MFDVFDVFSVIDVFNVVDVFNVSNVSHVIEKCEITSRMTLSISCAVEFPKQVNFRSRDTVRSTVLLTVCRRPLCGTQYY